MTTTRTTDTDTDSLAFYAGLWAVTFLLGLAGLACAAVLAISDLADPSNDWYGFGLILAAYLAVPSGLITLAGVLGGRAVERRRRSAGTATPRPDSR